MKARIALISCILVLENPVPGNLDDLLTLEQQENSVFLYYVLLRFFLSTNFKPGNMNYIVVKQIFIGIVKSE